MGLSSQERGVEIPKIGAGEADSLQQQQREKAAPLQCPRCDSKNTKFCYYNNYSKLQPRHFCKACRRYWTEGGVLRDVPVGRSRKNKRLKTAHGASAADGINSRSSTTIAAGQQQPQLTPSGACPVAFLHEDLLHPSQLKLPAAWDCTAGGYVESVPSLDPLPPEYFAWAEEPAAIFGYRFEDMFDPFSPLSSSSSSSPLDDHARRDARLVADVDGGASSWQEGHAAGSHLRCWDEVFDMVDSELKPHGSE